MRSTLAHLPADMLRRQPARPIRAVETHRIVVTGGHLERQSLAEIKLAGDVRRSEGVSTTPDPARGHVLLYVQAAPWADLALIWFLKLIKQWGR